MDDPSPPPARLIRGGTVYDGGGGPGFVADVYLRGDKIEAIGPDLALPAGAEEVDARGAWVTPGFVDIHTHYDAEVELAPALGESVRHGVTTVLLGSCGLSLAVGRPVDLADMFCRVEGIPRSVVLPLLERIHDWEDPAGYLEHLGRLPLGPNVACLLGHSTIRAAAMGIERALADDVAPTEAEHAAMARLLEGALDAGYLGLSINTLPWDKMDGDEHRSRPTPSVYASWSEYRRLMGVLRRRDRVLQGVPNLATKLNVVLFLAAAVAIGRPRLRTTLIALMDPKADRLAPRLAALATRFVNRFLGGDLRFQALPNPFDLWTDGLEVPVMEEIGAGTAALHEVDPRKRAALLRDPTFRARFRREWGARFLGRAWHRDLYEARILACPEAGLAGRTFGEVADARGVDALDLFLDLQAEHGAALRWYSVVANDQPAVLEWILTRPDVLIGFSDAGAHLRNMAYYNFPLRLLYRVREAEAAGRPFMTVGRAVERLTHEPAAWFGVDAGRLEVGGRADVVVLDPGALDDRVEAATEAPMPGFPGLKRMVRRNDDAVRAVYVGGRPAWREGAFDPAFGQERGYGRVLRATGTGASGSR